ncbi:MAG TPA: hypothetical protein VGC96_02630 [Candidatus Elarobacter sp.]
MTIDNSVGFLIVAAIIISSIASTIRAAKKAISENRGGGAGTVQPNARPRAGSPEQVALQQRVLAVEAEMTQRGITPSPVMQALLNRFGGVTTPPPAPQAPAPPRAPQPEPAVQRSRRPVPVARSTDVPAPSGDAPASGPSPTRRMLAAAFGDPARARDAVVLAEVLAPPLALR